MKAIKLSLLLAFAMLATTASAQFVNSGNNAATTQQMGGSSSSFDLTSVKTSGWFGIFVSYNPSKLSYDIDGVDDIDFKGFTVGLMRGFSLTKKAPLYLEAGFAFQYRTYKEEDSESSEYYSWSSENKTTMMSFNIPVNLLYRFNITDAFSISPYFGLDFRLNLVAKQSYEITLNGESESGDLDMFDENDVDNTWGLFQAGWHIGIAFDYNALHIGVDYGTDFNEICDKAKISSTSITVGVYI